ncbi:hypothetical protein FPZ42_13095 [Mucilaginibacter achroorhodeus]|uniref:Uncharacterized protein n=1 Tax=Mucilaginibacter achroorhodeus TaxID=2599294 RepID=A0A563U1N2_9SPHI|nr:hypothetical protein [Mucilaginibacter achroorhodeus]TWR25527.1 hypothetical protein FPZ42_13095 [Mucilaginibacter achroorhodeus]
MKSKEEILAKYYTMDADGLPEISADGLLKAMEEYRDATEEAAFNAARQNAGDKLLYANFSDYREALKTEPLEPSENEKVKFVADSIVEQFLPSDPTTQHFSFQFRTEGKEYTARYIRNVQGYWEYESFI